MSGFVKFIGVVLILAGIVLGIYVGQQFPLINEGYIYNREVFNWPLFVGILIGGLIHGILFLAIGEVLRHLGIISDNA